MSTTSPLALFCQLVTGHFLSEKIWHKNDIKTKFLLRSATLPLTTRRHLQNILTIPAMRTAVKARPMLPTKIHRPYLHAGMCATDRVDAIGHHYRFIDTIGNPFLKQAFLTMGDHCLTRFSGKNDEIFSLLCSISRYDKEGETTLRIRFNGVILASLSFTVIPHQNGHAIMIGGLQGKGHDDTRERTKEATKASFGLFPKRLLLECLLTLAETLKINTILAVGDGSHVYQNLRYYFRKKKVLFASYSDFWAAVSAVEMPQQLYRIPAAIPRKNMADLPSRKRSEYQRRYQLLDDIQNRIRNLNPYSKDITPFTPAPTFDTGASTQEALPVSL
ncbi:VirK/YbjX family protein [Musicola keenii]|uniref:VirK/YbjX family protein n=1 Tax=Musicola keenii TaxID=2884250 RepID=UPI001781114C|nr:VirK/YbjX family protein [Musicola keenii]